MTSRDRPAPNETSRFAARAITRRDALRIGAGIVGAALVGCRAAPSVEKARPAAGRLVARPATPSMSPVVGRTALGLSTGRDGIMYVPASYNPSSPVPLVLMLHGAGQSAEIGIAPFLP